MFKAFKFVLKPNKEQEQTFINWMGCSRFIWNHMLELNKKKYNEEKKFIFKMEMSKLIPQKKKEFEFLKEAPAHLLLNRVFDLDNAISRVWKQGNGFPKFKSRHEEQDSTCCINQVNNHIKPTKKQIKIPKIGWVKWKKYRNIEGKLKNITIKQEQGKWFVVCLCELPDPIQKTDITSLVGIDVGLKEFCITSDNKRTKTPKFYRKQQQKLKRAQQVLARRKKGSQNRLKARVKLAKIHKKIRHQRQDFTHKVSTQITKEYDFIAIEDLNIKGMQKNRRLAKSISDQGWAMFFGQLEYKSRANGARTVKIDRFAPSTKTCSNCGEKHNMPLAIRQMDCDCGFVMDRDLNASINIRRWGKDILVGMGYTEPVLETGQNACGDTTNGEKAIDFSSYVSMKQEKRLSIGQEAATL